MAMSRDPRSKFRKNFIFFLILHLISVNVTKFPGEKLSTSEVSSKKPHGGVKNTPPPSAFRVKLRKFLIKNLIEASFHMKINSLARKITKS